MNDKSLSLTELNQRVRDAIRDHLPDTYWVRAETSDVRRNRNGHCYLEFLEKNTVDQSIVAKARGVIWSGTYEMLSAYFQNETGQQFTSGLNVLVCVSVTFHELYGYSLTVVDIDPSYTLGEIARNRQLILERLEADGVLNLNKELELPELANRIAVISSPTAAGFEDFCNQLDNNPNSFVFYTKLFPAIMQGDRSESSIIAALEKIFINKTHFDVVAIIRGGGASADLNCFDSYLLANNVAQFPLPVISGVGHERDTTVLDYVSHTRAKTPTAVAEFFISHVTKTAAELLDLQDRTVNVSERIIQKEHTDILSLSKEVIHRSTLRLQKENTEVDKSSSSLKFKVMQSIQNRYHFLERSEQYINMISPINVLKRGYTIVLKNGKIVTSINDVEPGDTVETRFRDGIATSKVVDKMIHTDSEK